MIGLGGAFVAVAQGPAGASANLASLAVRPLHSVSDFDYDLAFDAAISSWLPGMQFVNAPRTDSARQRSVVFGSLSLALQWRMAGIGFSASARRQALQDTSSEAAGLDVVSFSGNFGVIDAGLAYGFSAGEWVIGAGPRIIGFSFGGVSGSRGFSVAGVGAEAGALYKPHHEPFRVGIAAKSAVTARGEDATSNIGQSVWVPEAVSLPWQIALGVAYQVGPRPLNLPWRSVSQETARLRRRLRDDARQRHESLEVARRHASGSPQAQARFRELRARVRARNRRDERFLERVQRRQAQKLRQSIERLPRRYLLVSAELSVFGPSTNVATAAALGQEPESLTNWSAGVSFSPRLGIETEAIPMWLALRAGSYLEPMTSSVRSNRLHGTFGFDLKMFHWDVFGLLTYDGWTLSAAVDVAERYINTSASILFWH